MADPRRPPDTQPDPHESSGPTPMHLAFSVGQDGQVTADVIDSSFEQA